MKLPVQIFGVIGHPVSHSLGPHMHNAAFRSKGMDALYLAFDVTDPTGIPSAMRTLGIGGMSVTLPHKEIFLSLVDHIDPTAKAIGAVNTLRLEKDGSISGFNTDAKGARDALLSVTSLEGKKVAVLGAGGAGRAVAFGVKEAGGIPLIINRSRKKGEALARELGASFFPLSDFWAKDVEILVNTTSVGMVPETDQTPISPDFFHENLLVMDIVYTPRKTKLLRLAEEKGCKILDGLEMFVRQGALQFELWTGKPAPIEAMRKALEDLPALQME